MDTASFINRRRFLLGTAGACAAIGVGASLLRRPPSAEWQLASRTSQALGSAVTISAWHQDAHAAEAALDAAFAELELVESVMSLYRPDSQVSRLNRDAGLNDPHPYLTTVLTFAAQMAEQSAGAFDVTVQPLWQLYRTAQSHGQLPDADAIVQARSCVDW